MRAAPPVYDRQDQQDVRNEISALKNNAQKPLDEFYMNDLVDNKVYKVTMESGAFVIVAL